MLIALQNEDVGLGYFSPLSWGDVEPPNVANDWEIMGGPDRDPDDGDFLRDESRYEDVAPEDSMQDDSTHSLGHSDEWYPWRSRAVSHVSACTNNY